MTRAAVAEQIVAAAGLRHRQALGGEAIGAIEAAFRVAVAAVEAPDGRQQRVDARLAEEASVAVAAAVEQQPADHREVADRDAKAALRREEGAVAAERIGGELARHAVGREHRAGRAAAAEIVADHAAVRLVEHDRAGDRCVAAGRPVEAGVEAERLEHQPRHQPVEALARGPLHDRGDQREVEVGIAEIGARRMLGVEGGRVGERRRAASVPSGTA